MTRKVLLIALMMAVATAYGAAERSSTSNPPRGPVRKDPLAVQLSNQNMQNRVHRAGAMWINMTNYGFFGNDGGGDARTDPEYPGTAAPQLEYPGGTGTEYLFMGALWVGALVEQAGSAFPRVSVGVDGWVNPANGSRGEFFPGEGYNARIIERSTKLNAYNRLGEFITDTTNAVSQQDFVASYNDTLRETFYVQNDQIDGPHFPLGVKVVQKSYSWTYNYAQNFIIIDYEFENIATNYLKNVYVGMYMDADVGNRDENNRYTDDITGFEQYYFPPPRPDGTQDTLVINTAWIGDNDGRPAAVSNGSDFSCGDVFGARVLRAPNPRLKTSYNWWISNGDAALDFGPSWVNDQSEGNWTATYGTPMGDARKYLLLKNREFDYDQLRVNDPTWVAAHPQTDLDNPNLPPHAWKIADAGNATDLANGYDTRYLLSWGPLGVFDHLDPLGNRIYRLNPGEKFSMTVALVMGPGFHDPNHPQIGNTNINRSLFRFESLQRSAAQAARVYDNPMKDTHTREYPNGDGWYGEDTGTDGLFAEAAGDSVIVDGRFIDIYPGPDPDTTENNSRLDALNGTRWGTMLFDHPELTGRREDTNPWKPARYDYTSENLVLDPGDNEPDFLGPPPPPTPTVTVTSVRPNGTRGGGTSSSSIFIVWRPYPSEDPSYIDPFSGLQDFEGYRLYVSNSGLESDFSFIYQWDKPDWSLFFDNDSMAVVPVENMNALPERSTIENLPVTRKPVGINNGFADILDSALIRTTINGRDTTIWDKFYVFEIRNAAPLYGRYYSVTVFDYGDPKGGTESLESSKTATSQLLAPSGDPKKGVGVAPNPYRVDQDYTVAHSGGLQWENQDDGTRTFYPQQDRRIWFYNLPRQALIRIFTVSGDVVAAIPHNITGDNNLCTSFDYAECWNLQNRNEQLVASGLYLFSVEDKTPGASGDVQTGKFVIIR